MKHPKLRAALAAIAATIAANPAAVHKHAPALCRSAALTGTLTELRDVGGTTKLTDARRDELLEACVAGRYVELEVDVLAYTQKTGERNRNSVRFRDGAMVALGRTGKGTPVLRDHNQHDSLSKGGAVIASSTEKLADGEYVVRQTWKLTAPWAVEMALRGLMDAVSIGWRPTGSILCSACNAPVYTKCYHWPGDRLVEKDDESGVKRRVRAADGPIVVEWIYTEAELVETSIVNIGGVPQARSEEVRAGLFAALSAGNPSLRSMLDAGGLDFDGEDLPEENEDMDPELLKLLGLPASATLAEVQAAIAKLQALVKDATAKSAELAITQKDLDAIKTKLEAVEAEQRKTAEDKFIADALASGRITKADEESWRSLYSLDAKRAGELMAKREPGTATPAGAVPQRAAEPQNELAEVSEPVRGQVLHITGGDVPGGLYAVAERSRTERKEIAQQLAASVKALEMMPDPRALFWADRFGFEGGKLRNAPKPTLGAATTIAGDADLAPARVGFRAAFMQQLEQAAVDPLEMLYTTVPTNTPAEKLNWLGDLPGFEEWTGDRRLGGTEAFKLDLESKKWASGLRVKNDDVKYDRLGLLPAQISGLATKARRHRLDRMMQLIVNGFDGAQFPLVGNGLGYDGAFFFADAHRGGNDNKMAAALDAAGLTAAELLLRSMTTYDGADPLDTYGTHLIVGPKLQATAEKLLTQERLANGEDNYHRGKYKLILSNRIRGTQDDYWFLVDLSKPIRPFLFQLVEEISTSAIINQGENNSVPGFINDELWFGAQANYNMSYFEFRLAVGSQVA